MPNDPSTPDWAAPSPPSPPRPPRASDYTSQDYFNVVRSVYPNAVLHGGGRTPAHNDEVGGVDNSMHLSNQAIDFHVPGVPASQVFRTLRARGLPMTEQLDEHDHLHVGWGVPHAVHTPAPGWADSATSGSAPSSATPDWAGPHAPPPRTPVPHPTVASSNPGSFSIGAQPHTPTGLDEVTDFFTNYGNYLAASNATNRQANHADTTPRDPLATFTAGNRRRAQEATNLIAHPIDARIDPNDPNSASDPGRVGQQALNLMTGGFGIVGAPIAAAVDALGGRGAERSLDLAPGSVGDAASNVALFDTGVYHAAPHLPGLHVGEASLGPGAVRSNIINQHLANASEHVRNLMGTVNNDLAPQAPTARVGRLPPPDSARLAQNATDHMQYQQLLQHGSGEDIAQFIKDRGGPQPDWAEVAQHVHRRDNTTPFDPNAQHGSFDPQNPGDIFNDPAAYQKFSDYVHGRTANDPLNDPAAYRGLEDWMHGRTEPGAPPEFNYEQEYNNADRAVARDTHRQTVQDYANQRTSGWTNPPNIEVVHSPHDISDPAIRAEVTGSPNSHNAVGVFGSDGKVRLFSQNIHSNAQADAVVFHEGLAHNGLAQVFQGDLDRTMQTLYERNVGQLRRQVDDYRRRNPGASVALATEETLARASERGPLKPSWVQGVLAPIKRAARRMGLARGISDAEVTHILGMAHDAVINGSPNARTNMFRNRFMYIGQQAHGYFEHFFGPGHSDLRPGRRFTGRDDVPRVEISDHESGIIQPDTHEMHPLQDKGSGEMLGQGRFLGSILHHEALYKAYPHLEFTPVVFRNDMIRNQGYSGLAFGARGRRGAHIMVDSSLRGNELHDTLIHEVQHLVQSHENMVPNRGTAHLHGDEYWFHPAEIEARSTERRRRMDPEMRKNVPPREVMREAPVHTELTAEEQQSLSAADRLKLDPRYAKDQEYRDNVNEYLRIQGAAEDHTPPAVRKIMDEIQSGDQKFMHLSNDDPGYGHVPEDLEEIARHIDENYEPVHMTLNELKNKGLSLGLNPRTILKTKPSDLGALSARIARVGLAAERAEAKVRTMLDKMGTPAWTIDDQVNLASAIADRNYLVERFKGEGSEVGRALRTVQTFRGYTNGELSRVLETLREDGSGLANLADPTNPETQKFMALLKQALNGVPGTGGAPGVPPNPAAAGVLMSGVNKPYWEQYLTSVHLNMMLSGLSTHVKAPVDMATGITNEIVEKALAIPVGALRQMFGGPRGVSANELRGHIGAIMQSVSDAETWKAVQHAAATGEGAHVISGAPGVVRGPATVTPQNFAGMYGMSHARLTNVGPIPTGLLNKPGDLISAQDTFFRSARVNAELRSIGTRMAEQQLGVGASGSQIRALAQHVATHPNPAMIKQAEIAANRALLLAPNKFNTALDQLRSYHPNMTVPQRLTAFFATNLFPFIRVMSNSVTERILRRSPFALLDKATRQAIIRGGPEGDLAAARIAYGTAKMAFYWFAAGTAVSALTGSGPTNPSRRTEMMGSGWRPNALRTPGGFSTGNTLATSINPLDLHNQTANIVADARHVYDAANSTGDRITALRLATTAVMSDLSNMSWVSDITPITDFLTNRDDRAISAQDRFVGDQLSSFVPNILSQAGRMTDVQRDTSGPNQIANDVANAIPGLRQGLPIRYDVYGNPMQTGANISGVHTAIPGMGGNHTTTSTDPATQELIRLGDSLERLRATDSTVPQSLVTPVQRTITTPDGDRRRLTPSEFEQYQHRAGQLIVEDVRQEMQTPEWRAMTDRDRVETVRGIVRDQKANAREELFQ